MLRNRATSLVRGFIHPDMNEGVVTQPTQSATSPATNPTENAAKFLILIKAILDKTFAQLPLQIGDGTLLSSAARHTEDVKLAVKTMQHGINISSNRKDRNGLWNGDQWLLLLEDGGFSTQTQLHLMFWQQHVAGLLPDGVFGPASFHRMFG